MVTLAVSILHPMERQNIVMQLLLAKREYVLYFRGEIPTCVADEKAACASCDSETDCISDRKYPPKIQCFSRDGGDIFQTEENGNSGAQEDGSLGE